ncbi:MAG: pilus assembly protein TadG-related protein [Negativicutes bacterium]|nr:pilus assembly protein TadG-related protein [Negativicutes bacterium]
MLRKLVGNQRGSIIALFTLAFILITSMIGLVTDVGYLFWRHATLQNGIDAAALAGASLLPTTASATSQAKNYLTFNKLDPSHLAAPTFSNNNMQINLSYTEHCQTFVLQMVGAALTAMHIDAGKLTSGVDVTVTAAALLKQGSVGHAFDFTLFSGSDFDMLPLNGSNLTVNGSVHSDQNLKVNGSNIIVTGTAEAVGTINVNGNNISIGAQAPGVKPVDMPDYSSQIAASALTTYNANQVYNGNNLNVTGNMYVKGDFQMNGTTIAGTGVILATGNIKNNGNSITHTGDSGQVCYYSQNGDITINGNNITIDGILYAPKGYIHINGNNITINGRVIANTVQINGSYFTANGAGFPVISLPQTGSNVALVQ